MLNINNARTDEQRNRMKNAQDNLLCPFCAEGLAKIHQKEIFWQNNSWVITESAFPYEGAEHHYLIISKKHIIKIEDLENIEWVEYGQALSFLINDKKIDGGSIFTRFGNMKKNGSSAEHLHIHVLSGTGDEDLDESKRESIKIKLGYKKIV